MVTKKLNDKKNNRYSNNQNKLEKVLEDPVHFYTPQKAGTPSKI